MRAGGERGAFSSPGTSSPWADLSHFISLCGAHAGRVIPLSEFSRVPRDSGGRGSFGWGPRVGRNFQAAVLTGRLSCDPGVISTVAGFSYRGTLRP